MKRFLLFQIMDYYPSGGWNDFIKDYDSVLEAYEEGKKHGGDYLQIIDTLTMKEVDIEEIINNALRDIK